MDTPILEFRSIRVSLAIHLTEDFTGQQPIGAVRISLNNDKYVPVISPSGYYLFFKVKEESCKVQITSDYYIDDSFEVLLSDLDPTEPVKEVTLKPNPAYPFPNGTTLIRGRVVEPPNTTYAIEAKVEAPEKSLQNKTNSKGEYVLYFKLLTEDDIACEEDPNTKQTIHYVKTSAGKKLDVKASHGTFSGSLTIDIISEGISNNVKYIQIA